MGVVKAANWVRSISYESWSRNEVHCDEGVKFWYGSVMRTITSPKIRVDSI